MNIDERLAKFLDQTPKIDPTAWVARSAELYGAVTLGAESSVFPGCILRADIEQIIIGAHTNIQDGTIIHLADDLPVIIGDWVTVGHGAMVHACTIGDHCLIGMRSTILDGAEIGEECLIAAGAVVRPGGKIPPGSMVAGVPGKIVRELSPDERGNLKTWAEKYVAVSRGFQSRGLAG